MNKIVHKYGIFLGYNSLWLPAGAQILSVGVQGGSNLQVWALIDPAAPNNETRHLVVLPTGTFSSWELGKFVGTVSLFEGAEIYHVFEAP